MVKVVELDQWSATGNITQLRMSQLEGDPQLAIAQIKGGDSEAAKAIFGGYLRIREVSEEDRPSIGHVWFKEGPNGLLERYRANYDSSD